MAVPGDWHSNPARLDTHERENEPQQDAQEEEQQCQEHEAVCPVHHQWMVVL